MYLTFPMRVTCILLLSRTRIDHATTAEELGGREINKTTSEVDLCMFPMLFVYMVTAEPYPFSLWAGHPATNRCLASVKCGIRFQAKSAQRLGRVRGKEISGMKTLQRGTLFTAEAMRFHRTTSFGPRRGGVKSGNTIPAMRQPGADCPALEGVLPYSHQEGPLGAHLSSDWFVG